MSAQIYGLSVPAALPELDSHPKLVPEALPALSSFEH